MNTHRTHTLRHGDYEAVFRPEHGMLCVSLKHRGEEILRLLDDLEEAAASGRSVGIPLLYPWSNRLSGPHYEAAGRAVDLDPESPWLMRDWNQVLVHGVPWSKLGFEALEADESTLLARLQWNREPLLAVFPYEHELRIRATLSDDGLTIETTVLANAGAAVPVSFGYHPQLGLPAPASRRDWQLTLPAMQNIVLDELLLPTGQREAFGPLDEPLASREFDHGFALDGTPATMSISGGGRRVSVDFLDGYPYAQIYAPMQPDYISLEPMVAPTDALVSGEDLPVVPPGGTFTATFRVRVEAQGEAG